jgi:hypothetical protein
MSVMVLVAAVPVLTCNVEPWNLRRLPAAMMTFFLTDVLTKKKAAQ